MTGWLANRAVRTKVLLVVVILGVVALAGSGIATLRLHELKTEAEALYLRGLLPVAELSELREDMAAVRVAVLNHAVTSDPSQEDAYEQAVEAASAKFAANLAVYRAATGEPALADELGAVFEQYHDAVHTQLLPASRGGNVAEVTRINEEVTGPLAARTAELVQRMGEAERAAAEHHRDRVRTAYSNALRWTWGLMGAGLLLAVLFALLVAGQLVTAVSRVAHVVAGIAVGDLTRTADDLARMSAELQAVVSRFQLV
jgi:methyl-accepting chemotaxis protein